MPTIGPMEMIVVLAIVLMIFGPKRLPSLGRSLGGGLREFKESIAGRGSEAELVPDSVDPELARSE
jgi:sec-independent protein translocase protein TatA